MTTQLLNTLAWSECAGPAASHCVPDQYHRPLGRSPDARDDASHQRQFRKQAAALRAEHFGKIHATFEI